MENKNILIFGAILLGLVIIAGIFVFVSGNNPKNVEKHLEKKTEEVKKKIGVEEKPEIKEVKNNKTGKTEKIVDNGRIISIEYTKGSLPKIDAVDAKLATNISAISLSLDLKYNQYNISRKESYNVLITTPEYYNKTKRFLIYFSGAFSPLSYEEYLKYIEESKKQFEKQYEKICEEYKEFGESYYQRCLNNQEKLIRIFNFLESIDKDTYNKLLKLNKEPIEIYYLYDNGTEKIFVSKNLYATFDAGIYTLKDGIINILDKLPGFLKEITLKNETNDNEINHKLLLFIFNTTGKTAFKVFYEKAAEFYDKINKPYVLIERKVEHTEVFDNLFKNVETVETNKTIKQQVNEIVNNITKQILENKDNEQLSNVFKKFDIDKVEIKIAVLKDLKLDDILPKQYVNYEKLNIINTEKYLDEIENKTIEMIKKLEKIAIELNKTTKEEAEKELPRIINGVKKYFDQAKIYLNKFKETSFVDITYSIIKTLQSYFISYNTNTPNYYYNYNNVNPPQYYPQYNEYETQIKPINA